MFAASLDRLAEVGLYFVHVRCTSPEQGNIDHIVIAPTEVDVNDAQELLLAGLRVSERI